MTDQVPNGGSDVWSILARWEGLWPIFATLAGVVYAGLIWVVADVLRIERRLSDVEAVQLSQNDELDDLKLLANAVGKLEAAFNHKSAEIAEVKETIRDMRKTLEGLATHDDIAELRLELRGLQSTLVSTLLDRTRA